MRRVIWRGFISRKVRSLLTGIAVALGVALMSGTYILTDTINTSFAGIFATANAGNDVVVTAHEALGDNERSETSPITDAILAKVQSVPGVEVAAGALFSPAAFLTVGGQQITKQAPAFVTSPLPSRFESFTPVSGHFPTTGSEVALDQSTATRQHLTIGDSMVVAGFAAAKRYRIVGIMKFAGSQSFGGAGAAMLTLPEAQRVLGATGRFDQIDVAASPGVTPSALQARIRSVLPATVDVRTGVEEATQETSDLESNLGFLRTFLLIFAYVSLFVGAFIIFNTFSITVAQRTREFGLLRTLGASRRQIMGAVVTEGLLLGLAGSIMGLLAGIGVAPLLDQLFKAFGADLPDTGNVIAPRTIIVSLVVGTVVTLLAGLLPASRATRVPPVAAMREGVELPPRTALRNRRFYVPVIIAILVLRVVAGLKSGQSLKASTIVFIVALIFVAIRIRRRGRVRHYRVIPALARLLGVLVAWRGVIGRIARENTIRQPGRTAVTAASLMIGLALVTFVSILAAGAKATVKQAVDSSFVGNLIVQNTESGQGQGIPIAVAPAIRAIPGVAGVTPVAFSEAKVQGVSKNASVTAVDPSSFSSVYKVDWVSGQQSDLVHLGNAGTIVTKAFAKANHFSVGETITLTTPSDAHLHLVIRAIADDKAQLLGNLTIALPLARSAFGQRDDAVDFVSYKATASNSTVQPAVNKMLRAEFPQTKSETAAQFEADQASQVNSLLTLVDVLLALSVIVSLFGIVNTLILAIYERRRELGMMRAIGTSRRQIRRMIRYESIITALIGGVLGLVLGLVLGIGASLALRSQGFSLAIPVGTLFILLIVSGIAGALAGALPARRAARLDPLEALAAF